MYLIEFEDQLLGQNTAKVRRLKCEHSDNEEYYLYQGEKDQDKREDTIIAVDKEDG